MDVEIQISFPKPPEEVRARLLAFGREWRESKLPAFLLDIGVYGAAVIATDGGFTMKLEDRRRGLHFVLHAAIAGAENRTVVSGQVVLTRWARLSLGVSSAAVFAVFVGPTLTESSSGLLHMLRILVSIGLAVIAFKLSQIYTESARDRAAAEFRALLEHATARSWSHAA